MIIVKDYAKIIGKRLKEARKAMRLSQQDMGEYLKLSHVAYGDYERGEALPNINTLIEIGRILDKPITYFLGLDNGELPNGISTEPNEKDMLRDIWLALKRGQIMSGLNGEGAQTAQDRLEKMGDHPDIEPLLEIWPYLDAMERRNIYDYVRWRLKQQIERLNSSEKRDRRADQHTIGAIDLMIAVEQITPEERAKVIFYLRSLEDKPSGDD